MDCKSSFGENCSCNRADAAGGAGHRNRTALCAEAVPLERHDSQHRGVACGADGHRVTGTHGLWEWNQPIALHPRLLGIRSEMSLPATPTVQDDLVAGLPGRIGG